MFRSCLCLLLALALSGCASTQRIPASDLDARSYRPGKKVEVVFLDGEVLRARFRGVADGKLLTDAGEFELSEIKGVKRRRIDGGRTMVFGAFLLGAFYLLLDATFGDLFESSGDSRPADCQFDPNRADC